MLGSRDAGYMRPDAAQGPSDVELAFKQESGSEAESVQGANDLPPPPPTPPPSLPPTSRRTSVAGTYNYNKTLSEVQRLVKDTLRTTQGKHGTKKPQRVDQLQNRSERIAKMVATAVGQAGKDGKYI